MKYNPKIDYVFCRDFFYGPKKKLDEMRKRKIYKGQLKPYFKEEKYMLKAKRILQYIKRAGFNLSSIEKCYFLLTNKKLKLKKRKQEVLIDIIQNYQAFPTSYFAFEAFFMVITKKIFLKKWNVMMAEVIHNFIRLKERKMPVIFNYKKTKKVVDYLENHQEENALIVFQLFYKRVDALNRKYPYISLKKVTEIIQSESKYLKENFYVDEFWIHGSFARNNATKYSDIDAFILVSNEKVLSHALDLLMYLRKRIGRAVDGHVEVNTHHNSFDLPGPMIQII